MLASYQYSVWMEDDILMCGHSNARLVPIKSSTTGRQGMMLSQSIIWWGDVYLHSLPLEGEGHTSIRHISVAVAMSSTCLVGCLCEYLLQWYSLDIILVCMNVNNILSASSIQLSAVYMFEYVAQACANKVRPGKEYNVGCPELYASLQLCYQVHMCCICYRCVVLFVVCCYFHALRQLQRTDWLALKETPTPGKGGHNHYIKGAS